MDNIDISTPQQRAEYLHTRVSQIEQRVAKMTVGKPQVRFKVSVGSIETLKGDMVDCVHLIVYGKATLMPTWMLHEADYVVARDVSNNFCIYKNRYGLTGVRVVV